MPTANDNCIYCAYATQRQRCLLHLHPLTQCLLHLHPLTHAYCLLRLLRHTEAALARAEAEASLARCEQEARAEAESSMRRAEESAAAAMARAEM